MTHTELFRNQKGPGAADYWEIALSNEGMTTRCKVCDVPGQCTLTYEFLEYAPKYKPLDEASVQKDC